MKRIITLLACWGIIACAGTPATTSKPLPPEIICEPCNSEQLNLLNSKLAEAPLKKLFVLTDGVEWYLSWSVQDSLGNVKSVSQASYASFEILLEQAMTDLK